MYCSIAEYIIKKLVSEGFLLSALSDKGELHENSSILLYKPESPVMYVVAVENGEKTDLNAHEAFMADYLEDLQKKLPHYYCTTLIALTILAGEFTDQENVDNMAVQKAVDFVYNKEWIPQGNCFHVWWYLSEKRKMIVTAKNQPNDILHLKKTALSALEREQKQQSIAEIVHQAQKASAFEVKSENTALTWLLLAANGLILLFMLFFDKKEEWIAFFGTQKYAVLELGQYYRLITCCFLHTSIMHFVQNGIYLYFFGTRTEILYGKIAMTAIYFSSALGGSLLSTLCNDALSVGASGAVFGLIGAILVYSRQKGKRDVGIAYTAILLLAVIGLVAGVFEENVDYFGHLGGFLAGIVTSIAVLKIKSYPQ